MRLYFVWLHNRTDRLDDDVMKVRAASKDKAREVAEQYYQSHRFDIGHIYTGKEFKEVDPWWHSLMWGHKAVNDA